MKYLLLFSPEKQKSLPAYSTEHREECFRTWEPLVTRIQTDENVRMYRALIRGAIQHSLSKILVPRHIVDSFDIYKWFSSLDKDTYQQTIRIGLWEAWNRWYCHSTSIPVLPLKASKWIGISILRLYLSELLHLLGDARFADSISWEECLPDTIAKINIAAIHPTMLINMDSVLTIRKLYTLEQTTGISRKHLPEMLDEIQIILKGFEDGNEGTTSS